jgi:uncharacterized membrane protein
MTDEKKSLGLRLNLWLLSACKHWLRGVLVFLGLYATLPFVAPTLMKLGLEGPANILYTMYSPMCHQFAFRSVFLYGEQAFYPREIAYTGYTPYETYIATLPDVVQPNSFGDFRLDFIMSSRAFRGNEQMGYKTTLCARDVAIYVAMFIGAIIYAFTRHRLRPLPVWIYIIIGIMPIGLDGFSQLLSYPPFNFWAVRETAPFFRVATGAMFGLMTAWLGLPYIQAAMQDTIYDIQEKLRRAGYTNLAQ